MTSGESHDRRSGLGYRHGIGGLVFLLVFGILSGRSVSGQDQDIVQLEWPRQAPVQLGWGWRSHELVDTTQSCLEPYSETDGGWEYQDAYVTMKNVEDSRSLSKVVGASIALSANGILGGGSASVSGSMTSSSNFSPSSSVFVLDASVWNPPRYVSGTDPKLTPKLTRVELGGPNLSVGKDSPAGIRLKAKYVDMAKADPVKFYSECGDGYVSVVKSGARLLGRITVNNLSYEQKSSLKAAADFSSGMVKGSAAFESSLTALGKHGELHFESGLEGGSGEILPTSKEELVKWLTGGELTNAAKHNPRPFWIVVRSYRSLPDWKGGPDFGGLSTIDRLVRTYQEVSDFLAYSAAAYVSTSAMQSFDTSPRSIEPVRTQAKTLLEAVKKDLQACVPKPESCLMKSGANAPDIDIRIRRYYAALPARFSANLEDGPPRGFDLDQFILNGVWESRLTEWVSSPLEERCQKYQLCTPDVPEAMRAVKEDILNNLKLYKKGSP